MGCQKYEADFAKYELDCQAAADQEEKQTKAMALYEHQLANHQDQVKALEQRYRQQMDEYEQETRRVLTARELMWQRARVCLRCSTAYFNKT
jgi:hypothetical protein